MNSDNKTEGQFQVPQCAGNCVLPLSEEVCSRLVSLHGPMVKAACQRILGDAALAEDAAQEVFLLFVRKLPSLPPQTILGGLALCHRLPCGSDSPAHARTPLAAREPTRSRGVPYESRSRHTLARVGATAG